MFIWQHIRDNALEQHYLVSYSAFMACRHEVQALSDFWMMLHLLLALYNLSSQGLSVFGYEENV